MDKIKKLLGIYNESDMKRFKKDIKDAVILWGIYFSLMFICSHLIKFIFHI